MLKLLINYFKEFRFSRRFYFVAFGLILSFILSHIFSWLFELSTSVLLLICFAILTDSVLLFRNQVPIKASRSAKYKHLSNGDVNTIYLQVENFYPFPVFVQIIDELPFQFQVRDFSIQHQLSSTEIKTFSYQLRPVERGEYHFGKLNLFIKTHLGLIERHFKIESDFTMAAYPSFIKLKQFELMAASNRLQDTGLKKIRKIGRSSEFEQIKEYVPGDDIRTINWKATARKSGLMVNHYREERSQNVYSIIDMGRIMKMPFENMSLLDYAVNASLVIGHVAWIKQDKPGLICFSDKVSAYVAADRRGNQLMRLQEALYSASTNFAETNYEKLLGFTSTKLTQRSLILLYTNFETLSGLKRQLSYLRKIAAKHLVVVVFFENTELKELLNSSPKDTFNIYEQAIAQKFDYEKRQITRELAQYGILSLYTPPQKLTINSLNKYLEIKTRGLL